jgi:hypothetical protein
MLSGAWADVSPARTSDGTPVTISSYRIFIKCSDIMDCHFVHRHVRKDFLTYSESLCPDGSNHINFALYAYPGLSNRRLKLKKIILDVSAG